MKFHQFLSARSYSSRYIPCEDIVEANGKVACEISSADEPPLAGLMFNATLKDATVDHTVALLSCIVCLEKLQDAPKPWEKLDLYKLHEVGRTAANIQLECRENLISE